MSYTHTKKTGKFFTAYDLNQYTTGATKEGLSLPSQSVQAVNEELVTRRKPFRKLKLRWRKSKGSQRSLGWIPFKKSVIKYKNGQVNGALNILAFGHERLAVGIPKTHWFALIVNLTVFIFNDRFLKGYPS